jgi:hypothetical protein
MQIVEMVLEVRLRLPANCAQANVIMLKKSKILENRVSPILENLHALIETT